MLKTRSYEAQNLRAARFILRDPARYELESLLVQWALAVVGKMRENAAPEREPSA
jgi:hypothetical protein